jgi:hypothetical protein
MTDALVTALKTNPHHIQCFLSITSADHTTTMETPLEILGKTWHRTNTYFFHVRVSPRSRGNLPECCGSNLNRNHAGIMPGADD